MVAMRLQAQDGKAEEMPEPVAVMGLTMGAVNYPQLVALTLPQTRQHQRVTVVQTPWPSTSPQVRTAYVTAITTYFLITTYLLNAAYVLVRAYR